MAYVRDGIPYRLRPDLGASLPESCVIEISRPKCKKLIIWTMYRAPDSNLETFIQDLNTSLSSMPVKTELILLGDFNINFASSEMNNDKAKKRKLLMAKNSGRGARETAAAIIYLRNKHGDQVYKEMYGAKKYN